jgi:hypothetical protein
MDIVGKYLFVKMSDVDFAELFAEQDLNASTTDLWTVAGFGAGENSYGIWLTPKAVFRPDGKDITPQRYNTDLESSTFIRWDKIKNVTAYPEKPGAGMPRVGFHMR